MGKQKNRREHQLGGACEGTPQPSQKEGDARDSEKSILSEKDLLPKAEENVKKLVAGTLRLSER